VLAADTPPPPDDLEQVVGAAASLGTVVLDLPRAPGALRDAALVLCSMCVLIVMAEVRPLAAARAVRPRAAAVGVVVRRGSISPAEASRMLGAPLLGVLPAAAMTPTPRAVARVAAGVLDGLAA
jgi:hypothetical protein